MEEMGENRNKGDLESADSKGKKSNKSGAASKHKEADVVEQCT